MTAVGIVEYLLESADRVPTQAELERAIQHYESREARIIERFEAHPVTEYALQRALESDWQVDCFETRIAVLQGIIERHFDLESELMMTVQASMQHRDLRAIEARMRALRARLARGGADLAGEAPQSQPAAAE